MYSENMKQRTEYDRQEDVSDVTEGKRSKVRRMRRTEDAQEICPSGYDNLPFHDGEVMES